MAETLELSVDVLDWAAEQSGYTLLELANKISRRKPEAVAAGHLSQAQAAKFANLAGIPFGYLFLDTPPATRQIPIADFRSLKNPAPLSSDFFDIYDDIDFKLTWYRDMLRSLGADQLPFIGKFEIAADPLKVAADIRNTLGFTQADLMALKNADELFSHLSAKAEDAGVLVFKNSIAGNSPKRQLQVSEFRGFVLSDPYASAIFINGADAPAAWVFTLAHELAHIWFGDSGISDVSIRSTNRNERACNKVAAEFLVPAADFKDTWNSAEGDVDFKLETTRKLFKVSTLVIARRAYELDLITQDKYQDIYEKVKHRAALPKEAGGDYYRTLAVRNSKRFTNQVARLVATGGISFREAGQLLNTNPNNVMTYYAKTNTVSA